MGAYGDGYTFVVPEAVRGRVRVYLLAGECLLMFLRGLTNHWMRLNFHTETHDFPPDAVICGVAWDFDTGCFRLKVYHPSFDLVPPECYPPVVGRLSVSIHPDPTTESMARELDAAAAVIHDLREQLAGRGS